MIIVKLKGGFGNQLFQYALAIYIKTVLNKEVKLDTYWFDINHRSNTPRHLELDKIILDFRSQIAGKNDVKRIKFPSSLMKINLINEKIDLITTVLNDRFNAKYYLERPTKALDDITLTTKTYLDGYWQDSKFSSLCFARLKSTINFSYIEQLLHGNPLYKKPNSNDICIHIRRGDYVTNQSANQMHGVCSIDYYEKGKEYFLNKVERPDFYFFSDDPEWVKENFKHWDNAYFVSNVDSVDKDQFEFWYMASFNNFIIANSTYSWWAAVFSGSKNVVAPKAWFKQGSNESLLKEGWILL